jgi:hypothetical protein
MKVNIRMERKLEMGEDKLNMKMEVSMMDTLKMEIKMELEE